MPYPKRHIYANNCISRDTSLTYMPNQQDCKLSTSVQFRNATAKDFHLSSGDTEAIDDGKDPCS